MPKITDDQIHEIMCKHVNCSYAEGLAFAHDLLDTQTKLNDIPVLTHEHLRDAGAIIHSDGNIFVTNIDKLNHAVWLSWPDNCQICHGAKGGVRGNENVINGKSVCDYCHADGSYLAKET